MIHVACGKMIVMKTKTMFVTFVKYIGVNSSYDHSPNINENQGNHRAT